MLDVQVENYSFLVVVEKLKSDRRTHINFGLINLKDFIGQSCELHFCTTLALWWEIP